LSSSGGSRSKSCPRSPRTNTLEVQLAAEQIGPGDKDWEEKVVKPVKLLALDEMDELTHGWGRALSIVFMVSWMLAIGSFCTT